jgi:hypothetical protein
MYDIMAMYAAVATAHTTQNTSQRMSCITPSQRADRPTSYRQPLGGQCWAPCIIGAACMWGVFIKGRPGIVGIPHGMVGGVYMGTNLSG